MSTCQVPANALRGATKSSFAASEPGSLRLRRTFKRPKGEVRKATKAHVHPCCRLEAQARPCLRTTGRIQGGRGRSCCAMVKMSKAKRQDKATVSSSTSEKSASRAGATKASEQEQQGVARAVVVIIRRGVGAASPHCTGRGCLTLNLAPHRTFGGASHPAAVLVPPALPCFSGAWGTTPLTCVPSSGRGGIRSCSTRLARCGAASHTSRTP